MALSRLALTFRTGLDNLDKAFVWRLVSGKAQRAS